MSRWIIPLVLVLVAWAAFVALVWVFQRRLIYFPVESMPAVGRLLPDAVEVEFATTDGVTLRGWLAEPAGGGNGGAVLIFNGNAGNRSVRAPIADAFRREGFVVLLFDYRGYGGNPGRPTEVGLIADGLAARRFLDSLPGIDPQRVLHYGESLGAAVAVAVTVDAPPQALILRSPFTSMVDVGRLHYPFLPVGRMLTDRYRSDLRIALVSCPLLVVAGVEDRIVPHANSRRLFEAAPSRIKQFISIPGADHNDAELIGSGVMRRTILFLRDEADILQPDAAAGARRPEER